MKLISIVMGVIAGLIFIGVGVFSFYAPYAFCIGYLLLVASVCAGVEVFEIEEESYEK